MRFKGRMPAISAAPEAARINKPTTAIETNAEKAA